MADPDLTSREAARSGEVLKLRAEVERLATALQLLEARLEEADAAAARPLFEQEIAADLERRVSALLADRLRWDDELRRHCRRADAAVQAQQAAEADLEALRGELDACRADLELARRPRVALRIVATRLPAAVVRRVMRRRPR